MTAIWTPELKRRRECLLTAFAQGSDETRSFADTFDYAEMHRWSLARREAFWARVWEYCGVIGESGARVLVDGGKMPSARWFPDARLNFAQNLLRPRPEGEIAVVYQGEQKSRRRLCFREVRNEVAALAAHLRALGVAPGDRVAAYTHNGPEAVLGMLAAASIGAVWASCSEDFGARGVLERFGQIEPKVLIVSDGYFYKGQAIDRLDNAREIAANLPSVRETLVISYVGAASPLEGFARARVWSSAIQSHEGAPLTFEPLPFDHPLYIMFSSGTTGAPKCIVHGAGGTLLQHLKEHQLQCDVRPGDRVFYATTTGWMMWNWLVSALASRATILLHDGFPMERNGAVLFDFASEERATLFGVSAGYLKTVEKLGARPRETHDLAHLRLITSTGSPLSPESFDYVYRDVKADAQLASISGGTDIVSCFVCGNPWSPVHRGEIQGAGLGMAVEVWDRDGRRLFGEQGELVCTSAFPSMPVGFWNDRGDEKYHAAYFTQYPGVWRQGDYATQTTNGGFIIHGRSDSTLNPQGVRIGTADIYRIVETMPEVEEALAVAQGWEGGERIVLFVKLRPNCCLDDGLIDRIKHKLKDDASPRHVPAMIVEAPELPHTRSGKLVELAVREVINGRPVKNREALANPDSLRFFSNLPALTTSADSATPRP
ncbi:MAG: acetoacetate--CoA ligase [Methylocystis sp.]